MKVGDKVRVVREYKAAGSIYDGKVGILLKIDEDPNTRYPYEVAFAEGYELWVNEVELVDDNVKIDSKYHYTIDSPIPKVGAMKNNTKDGKVSRRHLHPRTKDEIGLAHEAGAVKYSDFNFMKGHSINQLCDAMERHIEAIRWGEDNDPDCTERLGRAVHHMGCVGAGVNMFLAQLAEGTLIDDRYKRDNDETSI